MEKKVICTFKKNLKNKVFLAAVRLWRCLQLRYTTDSPEILICHHTDSDIEVQA